MLVFPSSAGTRRRDFEASIAPSRLGLAGPSQGSIGICGGEPEWVLEDESPAQVAGEESVFLFQLYPDLDLPTLPGAPPQMEVGLDGVPAPSPESRYELFIGNSIYAFGPREPSHLVYLLTQVD